MRSFAARSTEDELMDGDDVSIDAFAACLASLASANTVTRARPPTLAWLARGTRNLPRKDEISLVDVGFGEGDMLRAIHRWAGRRKLKLRLVGMDLNPRSAPIARIRTDPGYAIVYRTGDAFADSTPIDFVVSSLTAHHMSDAEVVRFIRWMEAVSVRGWFINDLHRHPIAFYGFKVLSWAARWHWFVRHDGPISVARSFRKADWLRLLGHAGVDPAHVEIRWRFPFRLCVGRFK